MTGSGLTFSAIALAIFGIVCFVLGWLLGRIVGYVRGRSDRSREIADDTARVRDHLKRVADHLEAGEKRSKN